MEDRKPKPFVFTLMPFKEEFDDIYQLGIKSACKDAGAYCERVDEQIFHESILERIYNQIAKADIIVADMTGRNPNVFYETGYAHALGKRVILLTKNADDIPFDLKQYPHIVYSGKIVELKRELEKRVRWCIEHPKESLSRIEFNLQLFLSGVRIQDNVEVKCPWEQTKSNTATVDLELNIHNPTNRVSKGGFELGLVAPKRIYHSTSNELRNKIVHLPDDRCLHLLRLSPGRILPGGWKQEHFRLWVRRSYEVEMSSYEIIVRLFTEFGTQDFSVQMRLD